MTNKVKNIDELLEAMNLVHALHAKYLGAQAKVTGTLQDATKTEAALGDKRTTDIAKAQVTYDGRLIAIDDKYETDIIAARESTEKATDEVNAAYDALVAQQKKLLDDHDAVVDLLSAQPRGTIVINA